MYTAFYKFSENIAYTPTPLQHNAITAVIQYHCLTVGGRLYFVR